MRSTLVLLGLIFAAAALPAATAKVMDENVTIAGLPLHYKVVLPREYDANKAYPLVLAFPPGGQGMDMVQTTLMHNWAAGAQMRGYIVVIPAAPNGRLFYEEGGKVFPEFLKKLQSDYKVRENRFYIAGMSNGGISAFTIAAAYPTYFKALIGFPGYLPEATPANLRALSNLCVYMHVGELDTGWRISMQKQAGEFRAAGIAVKLTVEKGEDHVIGALTGEGSARLYDELEEDCHDLKGARP